MASSTTTTRVRETATASGYASEQRAQAIRLPEDAARLTAPLELRDGATLTKRAIRADNTQRLRAFHAHLSLETIYLRFFTPLMELPPVMAERLTHVDYENRMALVASTGAGEDEQIVGVVRHDRTGPTVGEVAFVVADDWQGRGIATALLQRLAEYARGRGFERLVAQTMGWNSCMHSLLRHCGFPSVSYFADGLLVVTLDSSQPPEPAYAA
jgi:GNAT superfamily N-acetyltransferase